MWAMSPIVKIISQILSRSFPFFIKRSDTLLLNPKVATSEFFIFEAGVRFELTFSFELRLMRPCWRFATSISSRSRNVCRFLDPITRIFFGLQKRDSPIFFHRIKPYTALFYTLNFRKRTFICSGRWIRTTDLRVMSPASYPCSIPQYLLERIPTSQEVSGQQ